MIETNISEKQQIDSFVCNTSNQAEIQQYVNAVANTEINSLSMKGERWYMNCYAQQPTRRNELSGAHYKQFRCLFDTGACTSVLSPLYYDFIKRMNPTVMRTLYNIPLPELTGAGGASMRPTRVIHLRFWFEMDYIEGVFVVCQNYEGHPIVGANIIRDFQLNIDPLTQRVYSKLWPETTGTVQSDQTPSVPSDHSFKIRADKLTSIAPRSAKLVKCHIVDARTGSTVKLKGDILADFGMTCALVTLDEHGKFSSYIANPSTSDEKVIARAEWLGVARDIHDFTHIEPNARYLTQYIL